MFVFGSAHIAPLRRPAEVSGSEAAAARWRRLIVSGAAMMKEQQFPPKIWSWAELQITDAFDPVLNVDLCQVLTTAASQKKESD